MDTKILSSDCFQLSDFEMSMKKWLSSMDDVSPHDELENVVDLPSAELQEACSSVEVEANSLDSDMFNPSDDFAPECEWQIHSPSSPLSSFEMEECNETEVPEELDDVVQRERSELASILLKFGIVLKAQDALLNFMKNANSKTLAKLPRSGRSVRPTPLDHKIMNVSPGELVHFGIENVMGSCASPLLYYPKKTVVELAINIDGVPIFKSSAFDF